MGKVYGIGTLRNFLQSLRSCGYLTVDTGPLLGGVPGGPYVDQSALEEAVAPLPGMSVLLRDNGPNVEVCSEDGSEVFTTVPTV